MAKTLAQQLAELNSTLTGGTSGKIDITSIQYNVQGLGLSAKATGGKMTLTADELINAMRRTSIDDPQTWAGIQYAMFRANYYGQTMPSLGLWGTSDTPSIKRFMEQLTANSDGKTAAPVSSFLTEQENSAITLGGNGVRSQIQNVTIPNKLDLDYIAGNALRKVLGSATKAQVDAFTKSFQSEVMSVARANVAQTQAAVPKTAVAPVMASEGGHYEGSTFVPNAPTAVQPPQNTLAQNLTAAQAAPTVTLQAQQSAPDTNVAAEAFARKANPKAAAVHGLSDAMNSWFTSLSKGNQ